MAQPDSLARSGPDLPIPPSPAADTLRRLLGERFSCRGFLPQPVPQPAIEAMFGLAQLAPSGCNSQPWHTTITSGAATERFRAALTAQAEAGPQTPDLPFPAEYRGAYRQRRRDAAWSLYRSLGIAHGDRAASAREMLRNFGFFGAPHVAIITTDEALGPYGTVDTGVYLGTLLLAAHSLGIAAVPQGAVAEQSAFIRTYLGIPPGRLVVCGVSFGYADPAHPTNGFRTARAPLADAATFLTE
jgi:nitroreductase